jgi:hypothetical protein
VCALLTYVKRNSLPGQMVNDLKNIFWNLLVLAYLTQTLDALAACSIAVTKLSKSDLIFAPTRLILYKPGADPIKTFY